MDIVVAEKKKENGNELNYALKNPSKCNLSYKDLKEAKAELKVSFD